jgi:hypothetical protein
MPFHLDDGTEINPADIVIPDKCLKCKLYRPLDWKEVDEMELSVEWEERVFCILSRMEYMNQNEFYCNDYAYNPKWKSSIN